MDWTWTGGTSLLIKLSHKDLVETVMVTVIMTVSVDLVMIVVVTMVVAVHREVVVVGTASSVGNLVILLESAHLGMVGEGTDMVAEMTGMVVAVAVAGVMDLTVVVTDTLAVAEMVAVMGATATAVTDQVLTDGLVLEKYVPSRYGSLSTIIRLVIVSGTLLSCSWSRHVP
jgi:hypothetical protein